MCKKSLTSKCIYVQFSKFYKAEVIQTLRALKTKMKEQDLIFLEETESVINLIRGLTPDFCCQEKFSILASFIVLTKLSYETKRTIPDFCPSVYKIDMTFNNCSVVR